MGSGFVEFKPVGFIRNGLRLCHQALDDAKGFVHAWPLLQGIDP